MYQRDKSNTIYNNNNNKKCSCCNAQLTKLSRSIWLYHSNFVKVSGKLIWVALRGRYYSSKESFSMVLSFEFWTLVMASTFYCFARFSETFNKKVLIFGWKEENLTQFYRFILRIFAQYYNEILQKYKINLLFIFFKI